MNRGRMGQKGQRQFCRPYGTRSDLNRKPTDESVGYSLSPCRAFPGRGNSKRTLTLAQTPDRMWQVQGQTVHTVLNNQARRGATASAGR